MSLLRIAVPNKGSLAQSASDILRESGYRQRDDAKQLTLTDEENGVEFFYLRPRDIALYVGEGTLDVGITGRDLLRDSGAKADEVLPLGFGRSRFRFAGPAGRYTDLAELAGTRIATSYVGVVSAFLEERGIEAEVVRLDGAVETSIQLGVADVIADVVETGSTLRAAGLEVFGETLLESEAVLITRSGDVPPGLRDLPAPGRGRPRGPDLRDDGLRHRAGERLRGGRAHPRHRGPDDRTPPSGGLGRRARDGAPRRRPAADGRALRARCAGDPAHGHPCLPALTRDPPPRPAAHLAAARPARRRHRGDRRAGRGGRGRLVQLRRRDPRQVHLVPARHPGLLRADLPDPDAGADPVPRGGVRRPAGRGQRLPPPRVRVAPDRRRPAATGRARG